jgi:hypothetical protein
MGRMHVPNKDGDQAIHWDPDKKEDVKEAEETFDRFLKKGYLAYTLNKKGKKGAQIKTFDPDLEVIHFAKKVVGG